ncbi:MAG: Mrp/NBP35 family ATP-binding protein [Rhodothermales bacterium]
MTVEHVLKALAQVVDPDTGSNVLRLDMIKELQVSESGIAFTILLHDPTAGFARTVETDCRKVLAAEFGPDVRLDIRMDNEMLDLGMDLQVDGQTQAEGFRGVRNIIAVASGKGGVGKSTVSVNLAVALARQGFSVGLVDADIYGPSIPTMFGVENAKPRVSADRRIIPLEKFGVKLLSMGFLVDPEKAVIWRGPMVTSAIKQFLGDTEWGNLDYLLLDLPPGTGDIQLTIVQTVPLNGAVIVSTPQRVALADARKGVAMFEQVGVPVLGLVENMAWFTPPELPENRYYLFGKGGARALANELGVPLLAELPIQETIRQNCDDGTPAASEADTSASKAFAGLAQAVDEQVILRNATRPATEKVDILHR